jgi:hypothetical protein
MTGVGREADFRVCSAEAIGATTMSRVVAGNVCYRATAKITSTADMRRIAARQHRAEYGLAASGCGSSGADIQVGSGIVVS